jgi:hypothetical protein
MKNKIFAILAALLTLAPVFAWTTINLSLNSPEGRTTFREFSMVAGYDSQSESTQPTASVYEWIQNEGSLTVDKSVSTYGTGLAWPNRNSAAQGYGDNGWDYGEWSMREEKYVHATGETWKEKKVDVWTVHPEWWTEYSVYEMDQTNTQMSEFENYGEVTGGPNNPYVFHKTVYTDEPLYQEEVVCINPWDT